MATVETLRTEFRSHMGRTEMTPEGFRRRCLSKFQTPGLLGRYVSIDAKDFTPEEWVKAADAVADDDEYERDCDGEGFMGTGMSEASYFTAAGSAE